MGLIVETNTVHVPASRVCTESSSSSNYEETGSFDMSIYRRFSMQDDMKTLPAVTRAKNEFELFVQYAEAKALGAVSTSFDSLDTYLGTVGVTNEMCEV
jgi:hypothetical protein